MAGIRLLLKEKSFEVTISFSSESVAKLPFTALKPFCSFATKIVKKHQLSFVFLLFVDYDKHHGVPPPPSPPPVAGRPPPPPSGPQPPPPLSPAALALYQAEAEGPIDVAAL
uniref:Uncharacterized protein n=1 Tax=Amphimedon queenslandica TaxID=400682 RepID=A0A1X7V2R9_AMPQE